MDRNDYYRTGSVLMSHDNMAATGAVNEPACFPKGDYQPISFYFRELRHVSQTEDYYGGSRAVTVPLAARPLYRNAQPKSILFFLTASAASGYYAPTSPI